MSCPEESVLIALADGRLEPIPSELEAHIDACAACRAAVVAVAVDEPEGADGDRRDRGAGASGLATEAPGRYEVLGECGRGGQSRVLRVFDHRLDQEVALKQLEASDELPLRRFLREVRIMGELAHPAVVPVHDVGLRESGAPYYTMPLVSGRTLAAVVSQTPDLSARLRLLPQFVQVCHAVGAAHARGILHRDVKPHNIMLGPFGRAFLLDWGLAKFRRSAAVTGAWRPRDELDDEPHDGGFTRPGTMMGTPAYMSPEQAVGDPEAVDERSDVWSLGAVLFYLLAARSAFEGASTTEIISAVSSGEYGDLRHLEPELAPELVAIVERAMHRDRDERYPAAAHVADDLIAFQNGGRVTAYDYSRWERLQRFTRRHWSSIAAVTAVFATLAISLVVVTRSYRREAEQRQRAERAQASAERERERAERESSLSHTQSRAAMSHLARAHVEKAERLRDEHKVLRARVYAASSRVYNPANPRGPFYEPSSATWMTDGREVLARSAALLLRSGNDAVVGSAADLPRREAIEPREIRLAEAPERMIYAVAGDAEQVEVRGLDGEAGAVSLPGHRGGAELVDISPSGRFVVTRDSREHLRLWTLPAGTLRATWSSPTVPNTRVTVSNTGAVASIDAEQRLVVRELASGTPRVMDTEPRPAFALSFTEDGRSLLVGDHSGRVEKFDVERGVVTERWRTHETLITAVATSADRSLIAVGGADGLIVLCRPGVVEPVRRFSGHRGAIHSLRFSEDGVRLFSAASDGQVRGYDLELDAQLFELEGPGGPVYDVGVRDAELVAVSRDGVRRWSLRPSPRRWAKPTSLRNLDVKFDGGQLVLPSISRSAIAFLDTDDGEVAWFELAGTATAWSVVPRGQALVSSHRDGHVTWWARRDGRMSMQATRRAGDASPIGFAVHPDGSLAAIDAGDGAIALVSRDANVGTLRLEGHERRVMSMAFSPEGEALASASYDGAIVVRSAADGWAPTRLREGPGVAEGVAFSGSALLLGAGEFGVETWARGDDGWSPASRLSSTPHRAIVVGPRHEHAAGIDYDGHVKVWTMPDGELILDARGYRMVQGVAFDSDERNLWLIGYRAVEPLPLDRSRLGDDAELMLRELERAAHVTLAGEAG